ncbi:hypothetical protein SHO565_65950 [Streptomyces sp. HO565]
MQQEPEFFWSAVMAVSLGVVNRWAAREARFSQRLPTPPTLYPQGVPAQRLQDRAGDQTADVRPWSVHSAQMTKTPTPMEMIAQSGV